MARNIRSGYLVAAIVLFAGGVGWWSTCSGKHDASLEALPRGVPIRDPAQPIHSMELCEDLSEGLSEELFRFSRAIERGEHDKLDHYFCEEFHGRGLDGLTVTESSDGDLGERRSTFDVSTAAVVDRARFLEGFAGLLARFARIDAAHWDVCSAEFSTGSPKWGRAELVLFVGGRGAGGGTRGHLAGRDP